MTTAVEGPTCNAHHGTEPVLQAWGSQGAWCEGGLSGVHLVHVWTWVCNGGCQWYGGTLTLEEVDALALSRSEEHRSCPADCEWSKGAPREDEG